MANDCRIVSITTTENPDPEINEYVTATVYQCSVTGRTTLYTTAPTADMINDEILDAAAAAEYILID